MSYIEAESIAAAARFVPSQLGFRPSDSLVIVGYKDAECVRLGILARTDLPPIGREALVCEAVIGPLVMNEVAGVLLFVTGTARDDQEAPPWGWVEPNESGPPYRALIEVVSRDLEEAGIRVGGSLWLTRFEKDQGWWSYDEGGASGRLEDPDTCDLAMVAIEGGRVTHQDRAGVDALLDPVAAEILDRTAALLAEAAPSSDEPADPDAIEGVWAAIAEPTKLLEPEGCELVAELVRVIWPHSVQNQCAVMALSPDPAEIVQMWVNLTRATPSPWRALPATLLALIAYANGNGVLATAALDVALEADSAHGLASRLRKTLRAGVPCHALRAGLTELMEESEAGALETVESEPR